MTQRETEVGAVFKHANIDQFGQILRGHPISVKKQWDSFFT